MDKSNILSNINTIMEAIVYNKEGKKSGTVELPENIFGLAWNGDLVHDVVTAMATNARVNYAHTKDRGEVAGGGKKPWKQKGTGRARHGSSRSPIWVGGGVALGPRSEENYGRKINRKVKQKALFVALSKKYKDGEVIFVDSLESSKPSAKDVRGTLSTFAKVSGKEQVLKKAKNAFLIALGADNLNTKKSYANFGSVTVAEARTLNANDVLTKSVIVIEQPEVVLKNFASKKLFVK